MKEQLYTIPVNEMFEKDCECPVCAIYESLEKNAIEFTMGPSYMEDDIRAITDQLGFCEKHIQDIYNHQNRLGMALIMKTHMDVIIKKMEKYMKEGPLGGKTSIFKKGPSCKVVEYTKELNHSCYICNRISGTFERYIVTIFYLYQKEDEFRTKFKKSKGFCTKHYGLLYEESEKHLSSKEREEFIPILNSLYLENLKRVRDDVSWFIDKFDYRNADEPWKNSKDALPRAMVKVNSISDTRK